MLSENHIITERLELRFQNKPLDFFGATILHGNVRDFREIFLKNSNTTIGIIFLKSCSIFDIEDFFLEIYLMNEYQRRNFGAESLFKYIEEIFRQTNIEEIQSIVFKSNSQSMNFHKKLEISIIQEDDSFTQYSITQDQFQKNYIDKNVTFDDIGKNIKKISK